MVSIKPLCEIDDAVPVYCSSACITADQFPGLLNNTEKYLIHSIENVLFIICVIENRESEVKNIMQHIVGCIG